MLSLFTFKHLLLINIRKCLLTTWLLNSACVRSLFRTPTPLLIYIFSSSFWESLAKFFVCIFQDVVYFLVHFQLEAHGCGVLLEISLQHESKCSASALIS